MHKLLIATLIAASLAGCGIVYRQPIYQGSLLDASAVEQLQEGMAKPQVAALLGTPSISDPFHQQRWDYTATERVDRLGNIEIRNLTLWFEEDRLARWEGDYFPERNEALLNRMRVFPNLPRERR